MELSHRNQVSQRVPARRLRVAVACLLGLLIAALVAIPCAAQAASRPALIATVGSGAGAISPREALTLERLLASLPARYALAQPTHDTALAEPVRRLAGLLAHDVSQRLAHPPGSATARLVGRLDGLAARLAATRERFRPWPLGFEVREEAAAAQSAARAALGGASSKGNEFGDLGDALDRLASTPPSGPQSALAALQPFALYEAGPGRRLQSSDPELDARIVRELLGGGSRGRSVADLLILGEGRPALRGSSRRRGRTSGSPARCSGSCT